MQTYSDGETYQQRKVGVNNGSFPFYQGEQKMIFSRIGDQIVITKSPSQGEKLPEVCEGISKGSFPFYQGEQKMIFNRVGDQVVITKFFEP
jgi:ribosomal protein L31